jgi:hypothetical protein
VWFLGTLVTIKSSSESTAGRVAVTENLARRGSGSPLHVHHNEDEWFYVTEGELTFWVGGQVITAGAGSFVYGPKDSPTRSRSALTPHVPTRGRARRLRELRPRVLGARPAPGDPTRADEPPDVARLTAVAADYGVEIIGPPGIPA